MRKLLLLSIVLIGVGCANSEQSRLNPNLMTDEEIFAYNRTQANSADHIVCVERSSLGSRLERRECASWSEMNRRMRASGEQLNVVNHSPGLWSNN